MSDCKHEFTRVDMRGNWSCAKCGIAEVVYLRIRAEAAENERGISVKMSKLWKAAAKHYRECFHTAWENTIDDSTAFESELNELKQKLQSETTNLILRTTQLDELKLAHSNLLAENERMKSENLALRCCENCSNYRYEFGVSADGECNLGDKCFNDCLNNDYKHWKGGEK